MSDTPAPKRPRGKPLGFRKPDALSVAMKLRWKPEDIAEVKAAAHTAGEDASEFIRTAALHRARGEETLSTPDEKQAESKEQSARGDK